MAKHLIVTKREMWWTVRNELVEMNQRGHLVTLCNKLHGKRTQKRTCTHLHK